MEPLTATQNLAPTQAYFKYWSWILQYALVGVLLSVINTYFVRQSDAAQYTTNVVIIMAVLHTGLRCAFWVGLGHVFDLKQAATYAVYAQLGSSIVKMALTLNFNNAFGISLLGYVCWCVPVLVFLWTAFPNKDRVTLILLGVSTSMIGFIGGGSDLFSPIRGVSFLTIGSDKMSFFLPHYWYYFFEEFLHTLLLAAFISHFKHFSFGFRDKLVQLNHQYSNWQALFIYLGAKIVIIMLPYEILQNAAWVLKYSDNSPFMLIKLLVFIKTTISLGTLYFTVQYFRKFMLEHLYSRELVPSFNYWFMMVPILGFLGFLFTLTRSQVPVSARIQQCEKSSKLNQKNGVIVLNVILQLCLIFGDGFSSIAFILAVVSIGYFLFFAYSELALQLILGMTVLAFGYVFLSNELNIVAVFALFSLYQVVMMYILTGVFHIDSFEYLPVLEPDETAIK